MKWNKLFAGDGLPREKVDAVVRVVDRYLPEEAELHRLQSKRQIVHYRNLTRKSASGRLDMLDAIVHKLHVILAGAWLGGVVFASSSTMRPERRSSSLCQIRKVFT